MAIKHLAGNRMQGTDAERLALTTEAGLVTAGGGWKELDRLTYTGSDVNTLDVSGFAEKKYLMVIYAMHINIDQMEGDCWRAGTSGSLDAGTNKYSSQVFKYDNGSISSWKQINKTKADFWGYHPDEGSGHPHLAVQYIANPDGNNKVGYTTSCGSYQGALNSGGFASYGKSTQVYAETDPMDTVGLWSNTGWNGRFGSGSEIIVLGYDPTDTHTNNFWGEIGTQRLGTDGDTLEVGNFDKKKYLWVQAYLTADANNTMKASFEFSNEDTNTYDQNGYYSWLYGRNGELTSNIATSRRDNQNLVRMTDGFRYGSFNMFIYNESGKQKKFFWSLTGSSNSTGTGAGQFYEEGWGFLDNGVSGQITKMKFNQHTSSVSFDEDSLVTVWGAD